MSGCATSSPFNQDFVEVRTPNFVVTSSLGDEETLVLAQQLEFFHAGVLTALELERAPVNRVPSRVLAFDGRSLSRPFAPRAEPAYLMPSIDGATFVFRAGREFRDRATPDIRHRYAHRVLRDLSGADHPLWYEEGAAQLAGTIERQGSGVRIGAMADDHRRAVLDWRIEDLTSEFWRNDLSQQSPTARRAFEARAWAVVHTFGFADGAVTEKSSPFAKYRRALATGDEWEKKSTLSALRLGEPTLTQRVYAHLENRRLRVRLIQLQGWKRDAIEVVPLGRAESRTRLGDLALELAKPGVAEDYFERALDADSGYGRAHAGLALVAVQEHRFDDIEGHARAALETGGGDAQVQLRIADAYRLAGFEDPNVGRRVDWIESARRHYERVLALERGSALARVGMGATHLTAGGDPEQARPWFEAAQALRPGSLEITLWRARLEAALGAKGSAEAMAREMVSRTHWRELDRRGRAFIDALE
ncbi:MAG: hypothetical protein CL908_19770 [Deltaproteobacteria bacterium]|nr:hypothetical protein [Deltaproteobacteria bacterium]